MDDGSQGIDDQFIKNAMASPDVAGVAAQQDLGLLRRDRQVPRPRHAVQLRSGDRGHGVELAGVSHHGDQVDLAGDQLVVPRGGFLEQHRVLHQRIPRGHREAGVHAEWYRTAAKNELDLGGYTQAGPTNTTESPVAFYWNAAATYVTGAHTIKFGVNNRQGTFKHTRLANADLVQQYAAPPRQRRAWLRERSGVRAPSVDRAGHGR